MLLRKQPSYDRIQPHLTSTSFRSAVGLHSHRLVKARLARLQPRRSVQWEARPPLPIGPWPVSSNPSKLIEPRSARDGTHVQSWACAVRHRPANIRFNSSAGRRECALSRVPSRRITQALPQLPSKCGEGAANTTEQARALFGSEASTVVAFCALDAWLDGEEGEYRSLAYLFQRLSS